MEDFLAGWMGGCAGLLVGHPLDTVKVRQQAMVHSNGSANMVNVIRTTFVREGIRGFYKGMAFPLVSSGAQNCVLFGVFTNSKKMWSNYRYGADDRATYLDVFVIGGLAGIAQAIIPTCSMELVKIKLQMQTGECKEREFRGPVDTVRKLYVKHGVRGCFQGMNATIIREIPGLSVYMSSYEFLKDYIMGTGKLRGKVVPRADRWKDVDEPEEEEAAETKNLVAAELIAGGAAGVASWVFNIPMDVVKSRLQADDLSRPQYRNYWDCVGQSYGAEGHRIFWRGLPATCIRAFPANAVIFATYETSCRIYKILTKKEDMKSV